MRIIYVLFVGLLSVILVIGCKEKSNRVTNLSDEELLDLVQHRTFQYFWDEAEPVSGMARERYHVDGEYPDNDQEVVTTGGD